MHRTLLLTRPKEDSLPLARRLRARGYRVLVDPVIAIEPCTVGAIDLAGIQAIVVTSRHAVKALEKLPQDRPVFCVSQATARRVRPLWQGPVVVGPGDAAGLADLLLLRLRPEAGGVLHLAGAEVRPELEERLLAQQVRVERTIVYRARPATALRPATRAALAANGLDAVLLFSPRSAVVFAALSAGLDLGPVDALCLSQNVALSLDPDHFARVLVATRPDQGALLDLLEAPAPG